MLQQLVHLYYRLNFSTSQFSEAQEKTNIKTSQALGFLTLEVTLPKQKPKIFRRCQIDGIKIPVQNYIVSEGSWKLFNAKNDFQRA